jgi:hypothetical protein
MDSGLSSTQLTFRRLLELIAGLWNIDPTLGIFIKELFILEWTKDACDSSSIEILWSCSKFISNSARLSSKLPKVLDSPGKLVI